MADYREALIAFSVMVTFMTGLLAVRTYFRFRPSQQKLAKSQTESEHFKEESERLKELLGNTTTIGSLSRVYLDNTGYKLADNSSIDAVVAAHEVLTLDPVESGRNSDYKDALFRSIQERAREHKAKYFSLSEPAEINRYFGYSLALLRERN